MSNLGISKAQSVSLPKGGGSIQGIGESFQSDEFTGTSSLSIPVPTSPCRGFEPKLSVNYSSGGGHGIFGLGFGFSIPNISRKTSKGIPQYDHSDIFLLSNAEDLVLVDDGARVEGNYAIVTYCPRLEGLFAKIEHWTHSTTGESYWKVVDKSNITSIFGRTEDTRIVDPEDASHIFQWLLAETFDARGNHIVYEYKSENDDNISDAIYEVNRTQGANKYIEKIKYGNVKPFEKAADNQELWRFRRGDQDEWHFEVVFDYGEYDIDSATPYRPLKNWANRLDPFSTYRAGFEIRTHRLCRSILMFHRFEKELGDEPVLVHATRFNYQESSVVTLLQGVESIGYRSENGEYQTKNLPPLEFKYTDFQPTTKEFESLVEETDNDEDRTLPGVNLSPTFQLIDLYGEGIPGILYSDGHTTLYWEAEGGENKQNSATTKTVRYASPESPSTFPINNHYQAINQRLMDLTGNGQLELVVNTPTYAGYYQANSDRSWQDFQTFPSFPNDFSNPDHYLVDVTGDGLSDLVLIEHDRIWVYPSQGQDGFGTPLIQQRPEELKLPWPRRSAANHLVQFTDILGTGQQHLVRITNGKVECWPSLGYGRFGELIQLANAPHFEQDLDASRLFLADLDGSGTPDLIYAHPNHVEIFLNRSGNSFSEAITIPLPHQWDRLNQISFADVRGNGTTCLVFSENHPQPRHWCYDFSGNQKPYLLNEVENNLGAKSTITYGSSTQFYLADKKAGLPWIVNLPFPVHVVAKTESIDLISETRLVSTYRYHHGYYDEVEREFRGFGMVERQDAEMLPANAKATDVPPILTKTWYHTGAWHREGLLSQQYEHEYFQGDDRAYQLPDSVPDYTGFQGYQPDAAGLRTMHRALKGTVLREEVYALDGSELQQNPYTVTETNYGVRLLQERGNNPYEVYFVHGLETLTYHYERNPQDPRIQHEFVLEVTDYGNVKRACAVTYGRRENPALTIYPEQTKLYATVHLEEFIEETDGFWLLGIPYEQMAFEIIGLELPAQGYFTLAVIRQQVNDALKQQIAYGGELKPNTLQAHLLSWEQSYFWNKAQDAPLPLGQVTAQVLSHHHQQAVFSELWLQNVYADRVNEVLKQTGGYESFIQDILDYEGGYCLEQGYWWNKGLKHTYFTQAEDGFYLPYQSDYLAHESARHTQTEGLYTKATTFYDPHYLVPIKTEAYITEAPDGKIVTQVDIDYQTLSPWQLTDANQVIHQVRVDPLGMVIATSIFKQATGYRPRTGDGNLQDYEVRPEATFDQIVADIYANQAANYLQGATTFFYYNLFAWKDHQQPPSHISLMRQIHESNLQPGKSGQIQVEIGYSDGFGRVIEDKQLVEAGEAILRDDTGNLRRDEQSRPLYGTAEHRWLVSGRTTYNNKGKAAEKYLPYFSETALYKDQQEIVTAEVVPPPTVIHYDPLLREIRVDTPKGLCLREVEQKAFEHSFFYKEDYEIAPEKGFFSKVEFTPWETKHYDDNDTIKESDYYIAFQRYYQTASQEVKNTLANEKDALDKVAAFYNTPSIAVLDSLGNAFLEIQNNLGGVKKDAFNKIVANSPITSEAVWETLQEKGYLAADADAVGWATDKFQPYRKKEFKDNFLADLGEAYQSFSENILNLLKQNCLTEYHRHDIQGREIESIDARLYFSNITQGTTYHNFRYTYDMTSDGKVPAMTDSTDAGLSLSVNNIFGNLLWHLSPRNFEQVITYDRLQRKTEIWTKGFKHDGTLVSDNLVEVFTYGETQPNAANNNFRGQLYELKDQSGVVTNSAYNLDGELLETTRQLTQIYDHTSQDVSEQADNGVNWHIDVALEKNEQGQDLKYKTQFSYSALKQLLTETTPDLSVTENTYNREGLLDTVTVWFKDGTSQKIINGIEYDANRQRQKIIYENGVTTTYAYEATTLHLTRLHSTRSGKDNKGKDRPTVIQNIAYTYDPVGNITRLYNRSHQTVFHNQQKVEPRSDYTYDALSRLVKASGRQHPGIKGGTFRNNQKDQDFKQSKFTPLSDGSALENYSERYSYDNAGNLIKTTHTATNSWVRAQEIMPDSNRLKTVATKNGFQNFYGINYDRAGNQQQIKINNAVSLTWDYHENLVKAGIIERPDELDDYDYYNYSSDEMKTRKVSQRLINGGAVVEKESKVYLGNYEVKRLHHKPENGEEEMILERQTLRVMDDETCVAVIHYWNKDQRSREVNKKETRSFRYQLDNHLGSVALEVDGDAQVISSEEYFPYGGTAFSAGKDQREVKLKEYRYSGKEKDDSTGLYYYGARYYIPWLRRWLKVDPEGTVDGLNLYEFVGGNPIKYVDIEGNGRCSKCGALGHNKNNSKFHPKNMSTHYPIRNGAFVRKRHSRHLGKPSILTKMKLQGGKFIRTFTKASRRYPGKTTVYFYVSKKEIYKKYTGSTGKFFMEKLAHKFFQFNKLTRAGSENPRIGSPIHEKTSSQQFAKIAWKRKHGSLAGIPKNPSGTVNIRATGQHLDPISPTLKDHKGRPLKHDVDEYVSRDLGGSGSHKKSSLHHGNPGQNQWFMPSIPNSLAGAGDVAMLADAKKRGLNKTPINKIKFEVVKSFANL